MTPDPREAALRQFRQWLKELRDQEVRFGMFTPKVMLIEVIMFELDRLGLGDTREEQP